MRFAVCGMLGGALVLAGCNRRTEEYLPPDQEPPAPSKPVGIPTLSTPAGQLPGMPGAGGRGAPQMTQDMPPGMPPTAGASQRPVAEGGPPIRGVIRLADGIDDPGSGVLFVTVRNRPGPPLASLKLPIQSFPVEFEVGPQNVMIPTNRFEGDLEVSARIDRDGNPMTREPENLVGSLPGKVQPGATGLEIVLGPSDG